MRGWAGLLPAGLLLAGCAVAPPLSYPPSAHERLLRLALDEWREWGCATRGLPGPTLASCPGAARPQPRESAPESFPRVLAYWRAVPEARVAIPPNRGHYAAILAGQDAPLWAEPFWSAAFISWLMAAAGVDRAEFRPSAAHSFYLDHLDRVAAAHPATAPFLPHEPGGYSPAPGDLVCHDRSARPLARWADRAWEPGQFRPMHCDIVVATGAGVVEVVGGNTRDRVALTRLAADAGGRLLPQPRPVVVVVENRLGRLPPWGGPSLRPPALRPAAAGAARHGPHRPRSGDGTPATGGYAAPRWVVRAAPGHAPPRGSAPAAPRG